MDPLKERLTGWMRSTAAANSETHDLTRNALRIARRKRRQRTVAASIAGVAGIAVVAIAVPVGLNELEGPPEPTYANSGTETGATVPSKVTKPGVTKPTRKPGEPITIDLDQLEQGPPTGTAWYGNGVIHDGDREIPFKGPWSSDPAHNVVNSIAPVEGGYIVGVVLGEAEEGETAWEIYIVRPDGTRTELPKMPGIALNPVVSPDGTKVAYGTVGMNLDDGMLYLVDVASGRPLQSVPVRDTGGPVRPMGFLNDAEVLLERETNKASRPVKVWDTASRKFSTWYDKGYGVPGVSPSKKYVAVGQNGSECFATLAKETKQPLWRSCDFNANNVVFSPDDRLVATSNADIEHESPFDPNNRPIVKDVAVQVLESATGKSVLKIEDQSTLLMGWDDRDSLLLVASQGDGEKRRSALVRCSIGTGECERVSRQVPDNGTYSPFALAPRR